LRTKPDLTRECKRPIPVDCMQKTTHATSWRSDEVLCRTPNRRITPQGQTPLLHGAGAVHRREADVAECPEGV
jgi:hypothetical protein